MDDHSRASALVLDNEKLRHKLQAAEQEIRKLEHTLYQERDHHKETARTRMVALEKLAASERRVEELVRRLEHTGNEVAKRLDRVTTYVHRHVGSNDRLLTLIAAAFDAVVAPLSPPPPDEPTWTSTPPTEPGWYWVRYEGQPGCVSGMRPEDFDPRATGDVEFSKTMGAQWHPVPITPPEDK